MDQTYAAKQAATQSLVVVPTVNTSPTATTVEDEVASGVGYVLRVDAVGTVTEVVVAAVVVVVKAMAKLGPNAAFDLLLLGVCESFCPGVADLHVDDVFALDSH